MINGIYAIAGLQTLDNDDPCIRTLYVKQEDKQDGVQRLSIQIKHTHDGEEISKNEESLLALLIKKISESGNDVRDTYIPDDPNEFGLRLAVFINYLATNIARTTRRGVGNNVVLSREIFNKLIESLETQEAYVRSIFDFEKEYELQDDYATYVGKMNGFLRIYVTDLLPERISGIVSYVAFKQPIDSGLVVGIYSDSEEKPYRLVENNDGIASWEDYYETFRLV